MALSFLSILIFYFCDIHAEFNNDDQCRTFGFIGPREVKRLPTGCDHIYGNVWVLSNDTAFEEMVRVFSKVKVIYGCVSIHNSNYENLSFFEQLEKVNCRDNEIQAIPMVESFGLINNFNLKKLMMPNLVSIEGPETAVININGSSQLCFNEHDVEYFMMTSPKSFPDCKNFVMCSKAPDPTITNGSQIPESCSTISWDIVLEGEIEDKYLRRLRLLETLRGTFTLRNSTVTILDLSKLVYIQANGNGPGLVIVNNIRLVEVKLSPNFHIETGNDDFTLITYNPNYLLADKLCSFSEKPGNIISNNLGQTCRTENAPNWPDPNTTHG